LSFVGLTKYYLGAQILEDEMGGACGTYAGEEILAEFWWRNLNEVQDPDVDGRMWAGSVCLRMGTVGGL